VVHPARRHRYTYADYLALEATSSVRHEFFEGEIYAMAGGTPTHAALAAMIISLTGSRLPAGCRIYSSDLRIRVVESGMSTYPDVTVVCGPVARAADDPMAVINPTLLVEVTSPSTEDYDRGEKLTHYQRMPSVQEVLLVSHRSASLVLHRRSESGAWQAVEATAGQSVDLLSVGIRLQVDDVYRDGLEDNNQVYEESGS
jgi:Uma2 family endonuclease